jgi:hypothetical protein
MTKRFKMKQLVIDMNMLREQLQRLVRAKGVVDEEVLMMSRELDERIVGYLRVLKESDRL